MHKTSEAAMDQTVTDAIIEVLGAMTGALTGFTKLCDSGSEYLDAKTRERFAPHNMLPLKPPKKALQAKDMLPPNRERFAPLSMFPLKWLKKGLLTKDMLPPNRELPPKKVKDLPPNKV